MIPTGRQFRDSRVLAGTPQRVSINHDAQQSALEVAREDLLAAFDAKQEADRRYLEAFASYKAAANTLRRTLTVVEPLSPRPLPP